MKYLLHELFFKERASFSHRHIVLFVVLGHCLFKQLEEFLIDLVVHWGVVVVLGPFFYLSEDLRF